MQILAALLLLSAPRARDLGITVGVLPPGRQNAITDVVGVRVGHVTLIRGKNVRTGVTAILPHGGDVWKEKVPAGISVLNGAGEMTGAIWVKTLGALEVPLVLTNTMGIGQAMDGVVKWTLSKHPEAIVAPTVAECDDSSLNDAAGLHLRAEDTVKAIQSAAAGPVTEGAVGAGTGMTAFDFKAGIGTASRLVTGYTVGVLVNANMDDREALRIDGLPVGREIKDLMPRSKPKEGSIIVVVATDAPLDPLRLERLASKAAIGLARTGASAHNGSGDIFIAFSTGNRMPADTAAPYTLRVVGEAGLDGLFQATIEATEEAIYNALVAGETMTGRDDYTVYGLPRDRVTAIMKRAR